MPTKDKPYKISVVTVCRNVEKVIEGTIKTVVNQSYRDIEYIIVDGSSTDGTVDIIKQYAAKYPIRYISEPDTGIYNAMNKAVKMCTGDYVIFINAGDGFWKDDVVQKAVAFMKANKGDIYHGNCVRTNIGVVRERNVNHGTFLQLLKGKQPFHQCTFASRETLERFSFNETYKIRSDFDWFLRCRKAGYRICYMDFIISRYAKFGYSGRAKQRKRYKNETARSIKEHYPLFYFIYRINKNGSI